MISRELIQNHDDVANLDRWFRDPAWKTFKQVLNKVVEQEKQILFDNLVIDDRSKAMHNLMVGRVQAIEEILRLYD